MEKPAKFYRKSLIILYFCLIFSSKTRIVEYLDNFSFDVCVCCCYCFTLRLSTVAEVSLRTSIKWFVHSYTSRSRIPVCSKKKLHTHTERRTESPARPRFNTACCCCCQCFFSRYIDVNRHTHTWSIKFMSRLSLPLFLACLFSPYLSLSISLPIFLSSCK